MIDGTLVEDFIRANADPIFGHQVGLWEYIDVEDDHVRREPRIPVLTASGREHVEFITTEDGDDLIVAFAISSTDPGDIMSLILQRTPKYEGFLPPEERGVAVSHERIADDERSLATHIVVEGSHVDIATSTRVYQIDIATVDPNERARTTAVLQLMHRHGGFKLDIR
ncbi:hypothetical protein BH09GEM1_BH09GEM1_10510 [soil metagenome]